MGKNNIPPTAEEYRERMTALKGDLYDYSEAEYINNITEVKIFCKRHQKFFNQTPKIHRNSNCPDCAWENLSKRNSKGKEKFIKELIEVHGNIFDTSKVNYMNTKTEVELICEKHGSFFRKPADLLTSYACKKCKLEKSKYNNKKLFIEESIKLFGDITNHSKVGEISKNTKVDLTCTIHNHDFRMSVTARLNGQKCPKCAEENYSLLRKKTTEQFVEEAREVYGDLHDYSNTIYNGCRRELEVRCKKHDFVFKSFPDSYLDGYTCFKCRNEATGYKFRHHHTKEGYIYLSNGKTTYLYLIKCNKDNETFYKIGKTFRSLEERFTKTNMPYDYEEIFTYSGSADEIWDLEKKLHKKYKKYKHKVKMRFDGYSECYNLELPINKIIEICQNL